MSSEVENNNEQEGNKLFNWIKKKLRRYKRDINGNKIYITDTEEKYHHIFGGKDYKHNLLKNKVNVSQDGNIHHYNTQSHSTYNEVWFNRLFGIYNDKLLSLLKTNNVLAICYSKYGIFLIEKSRDDIKYINIFDSHPGKEKIVFIDQNDKLQVRSFDIKQLEIFRKNGSIVKMTSKDQVLFLVANHKHKFIPIFIITIGMFVIYGYNNNNNNDIIEELEDNDGQENDHHPSDIRNAIPNTDEFFKSVNINDFVSSDGDTFEDLNKSIIE